MSHSNLSSLYNDLKAHAKNMRLTTPRKVLFYTTWARRQRKCMYERILRDVSLSLNEFTVTPLWYLWNNYKRELTLPTLVPKKEKRISLQWTVYQQDAKFRPRLHGSGRILFLESLFTWIRANSVAAVFTRTRAKFRPVAVYPGNNRAIWAKCCRVGCLHGSVQIWNRAGQKVNLLFSGP